MRRLWMLVVIYLLLSLACDFSTPEISMPDISLPNVSMPQIDLSQLNLDKAQTQTGSGKVVEENRVITNFTDITLSGIGDLIIEQGDSEGLKIEAEDNLIQYLRVEVNKGKLVIGVQPGITLHPTKPITYHLKVKSIEAINLTGNGSIETAGLSGRRIKIVMGGSGRIKILNLDANAVDVTLSGSGDIELAGKMQDQVVILSGAGSYKAPELQTSTAKITISGSGSAFVQSLDQLTVDISGSGVVHYKDNPEIKQNITGSGQIVQDK